MEPPFTVDVSLNPLFSLHHPSQRDEEPRAINSANSLDSHSYELILPAVYHVDSKNLQEIKLNDNQSLHEYLQRELDLSRLNKMHHHLWLAGLPSVGARPLHRQLMMGRQIILTERADLHLVWQDSRIYLKPMPEFLLDFQFWTEHLCQKDLWETGRGFLLSYLWLVRSKHDFQIAHDKDLLPKEIHWKHWVRFSRSLLGSINIETLESVNRRFIYGELRLNRLNWIYRISRKDNSNFVRGYMHGYNRYSVFVQRNFAWIIGASVYVSIVLTAMQVGLATDRLKTDQNFQNASYGFTVFAILSPIAGLVILGVVLAVPIFLNLKYTLERKKMKPNHTSTYGITLPGTNAV